MKNLRDILNDTVEPISLSNTTTFDKFLTEEADFADTSVLNEVDDPFGGDDIGGGDAGGDDAGGDLGGGDDLGGDAGGGDADPFGDAGGDMGGGNNKKPGGAAGGGGADSGDSDDAGSTAIDLETHEDDPEFNQGELDPDDVTLSKTTSAKAKFNLESIMKTVASVIQSISEDKLLEIDKVKNAIELIFNGKLLNDEDLEFKNIKNAIFLIKKISAKLDITTRAYLNRKLKEPLIKKRDQIKQDIASKKGDLNDTRDMLTKLDTEV